MGEFASKGVAGAGLGTGIASIGTAEELDAQVVEKAARIKELRALIEEANA